MEAGGVGFHGVGLVGGFDGKGLGSAVEIDGADVGGVAQDLGHVNGAFVEQEFAGGDAGDVEQVVDEGDFESDVAMDQFHILAHLGGQGGVLEHAAGGGKDGSERGAKLVGQSGDELVLGSVGLFEGGLGRGGAGLRRACGR